VRYFDPQPADVPARMPSPFAIAPHPLARRAGEELARELQGGLADRLGLWAAGGGKMFGVLVVADRAGRIGYLRAFSGMVGGHWHEPEFAPPAFDESARDAFWPAGERELGVIDAEIAAIGAEPRRKTLAEMDARHERERDEMRERHRNRKVARHAIRDALAQGGVNAETQGRRGAQREPAFSESAIRDNASVSVSLRLGASAVHKHSRRSSS